MWQFERGMTVLRGKPLAAYLNTFLPKLLPKCFRCCQVCWTVFKFDNGSCHTRPWSDGFFLNDEGPEIQSAAEVSELPLSWYACHPPPRRLSHPDHCFPCTNPARITREAIQSIEVASSVVIREFKHSTSLQDDTSLNSLSSHTICLLTSLDFMTRSSLKPSNNFHAALEVLVPFL